MATHEDELPAIEQPNERWEPNPDPRNIQVPGRSKASFALRPHSRRPVEKTRRTLHVSLCPRAFLRPGLLGAQRFGHA